jgi:hypothetical protein
MTARLSRKIVATERRSNKPPLRLHGQYTLNLAESECPSSEDPAVSKDDLIRGARHFQSRPQRPSFGGSILDISQATLPFTEP